jgi:hypothetical protein
MSSLTISLDADTDTDTDESAVRALGGRIGYDRLVQLARQVRREHDRLAINEAGTPNAGVESNVGEAAYLGLLRRICPGSHPTRHGSTKDPTRT